MDVGAGLQCGGMNVGKLLCAGVLLLGAGCVSDPGSLGGIGENSGSEGEESSAESTGELSGTTSGAVSTTATEGGGSESGEEGGSTGEPIVPPACEIDVAPGLLRRLTEMQFEHAVEDLFAVTVDVSFASGWMPFASGEEVSIEESVEIQMAAGVVAAQFVAPACEGTVAACGQSFIEAWAPVVLRGQADEGALMDVYTAEASYEEGVAAVVAAMIADPAFVMVTPTGTMDGELLSLDGPSIATRLSLLLWNSVPDAELLEAADTLTAPGGIQAQLDRMFDDARYARAQADLYSMMTDVQRLPLFERGAVEATWSAALGGAMVEEQRRFVASLAADGGSTLETLLTSSSTFVNAELAGLYGDDLQTPVPVGDSWGPAELDPARRGGLLTQLGFIARYSVNRPPSEYETPSSRGSGVLQSVVCLTPPPPPPSEPTPPPEDPVTNRAEWEVFLSDPSCAGCHNLFDNFGYAYGNYDGIGRWDASEDSTQATDPTTAATFDGAVELGEALAEAEVVGRCFAERHLEFALRRTLGEEDACTVDALQQAFDESGGNLRALVEATATSEAFALARP